MQRELGSLLSRFVDLEPAEMARFQSLLHGALGGLARSLIAELPTEAASHDELLDEFLTDLWAKCRRRGGGEETEYPVAYLATSLRNFARDNARKVRSGRVHEDRLGRRARQESDAADVEASAREAQRRVLACLNDFAATDLPLQDVGDQEVISSYLRSARAGYAYTDKVTPAHELFPRKKDPEVYKLIAAEMTAKIERAALLREPTAREAVLARLNANAFRRRGITNSVTRVINAFQERFLAYAETALPDLRDQLEWWRGRYGAAE